MSAPTACRTATMALMHEDHGGFPPLATGARAVFCTARALADHGGMVADRSTLEPALQMSTRQLRFWLAHLEARRFAHRALVKRIGARELWVLLADIPGIPARTRQETAVDDDTDTPAPLERDRIGRKTGSFEWRKMRAERGGLKRAMAEAVKARKEAQEQLEAISRTLYADRQAEARLGASAEITSLRGDLQHAAACRAMTCARCSAIQTQLAEDRGRYATATALNDQVDKAGAIIAAGAELLASLRDQGLGAAARRAQARATFARTVEGS